MNRERVTDYIKEEEIEEEAGESNPEDEQLIADSSCALHFNSKKNLIHFELIVGLY